MRKHGRTPSQHDKYVMMAAISPPAVARGRFARGHQLGLAGCKSPPLFKRGASSCSSQRQRQREPWGASPQPSAPTYLPTYLPRTVGDCRGLVSGVLWFLPDAFPWMGHTYLVAWKVSCV